MPPPRLAALAMLASIAIAAAPARAGARPPAALSIAVAPSDASNILVAATYGLVQTRDGGTTWSWICDSAFGVSSEEDPLIAIAANGNILAGVSEGLTVSSDKGCDWTFAIGGVAGQDIVDFSLDPDDPSRVTALVSTPSPMGGFTLQLWDTNDDGATWTQEGINLPSTFLGLTIRQVPGAPACTYATGLLQGQATYSGVLEHTCDSAATWTALPIPGADDAHLPYLAGVDPTNPDVVYVRIAGPSNDSLIATKEGGATWTTLLTSLPFPANPPVQGEGYLGFALSPDGATIAVGGPLDGLWTAPASTLKFDQVAKLAVQCLTWTTTALYACADEATDGFTAGVSTDQGKTFAPLMHLDSACGAPSQCGAETAVGRECPVLGASVCGGAGGADGGVDGGGRADSTGVGAGAVGSRGGCTCGAAASSGAGGADGVAFAATVLARWRRSRSRPRRLRLTGAGATTILRSRGRGGAA